MKKGLKFIVASVALSLGIAAVGVATVTSFVVTDQNANSVKADPVYSNIYYVGSDNDWINPYGNDMTGYTFQYVGYSGGSHYYTLDISLTKDSTFKIRDWENGHESDWMASYDGTLCLQGLRNDDSGNLRCTMTGTYRITYRWASSTDRCITGFDITSGTRMYYIADNTTWAESGKIYLHAWGSSGDYTYWSYGCIVNQVSTVKVGTGSLQFYDFTIPTGVTGFQIKHYDGDTDYKTGNLTPSSGACFSSNSTADMGNAGAIIASIYSKLGSATYKGTTYSDSICAISSSDRSTIISNYNALNSTAKSIFDASTLNTYDPNNLSTKTNVSYATIINTLKLITPSGARFITLIGSKSDSSAYVVIAISAVIVALAGFGGFFLLRKRKEQD